MFLPGNSHRAGVQSLIDTTPTGHGQIIVTGPGATPDSKGFDKVLDNAEFDFASNQVMPGEFDLSWVIPTDAPADALICNYGKDTGGNTKGGNENRKAGACFTVASIPTTTTVPETTTTASVCGTTTTTVPETTTSVPTSVLGENFVRPQASPVSSQALARTGSEISVELLWAGVALALGGFIALFGERELGRRQD